MDWGFGRCRSSVRLAIGGIWFQERSIACPACRRFGSARIPHLRSTRRGDVLLANEALDILELKAGATPIEIKRSYRDLVKVWHPDRFGSDPRLRTKAEEKLAEINAAYRLLSSDPAKREKPAPVSSTRQYAGPPDSPARPASRRRGIRPKAPIRFELWLRAVAVILLVSLFAYVVHENRLRTSSEKPIAPAKSAVANQPIASGPQPASGALAPRANAPGVAPVQFEALPEADTAQLESACAIEKAQSDSAAYRRCLKAQFALISGSSDPADLSGLNDSERGSIQAACSTAKPYGYNRCLIAQLAELAADPARPDLSSLNQADRASIEGACAGAKNRGPAAYNHCRIRLVKLLEKAK